MTDLPADVELSPDFADAAEAALARGAPILCDAKMVANGITRARLPASNEVVCTLDDPRVPALAAEIGTTRSAAAMELWRERLGGRPRGHRQCADGPVPPPRDAGRGRAAARGGDRHSGRLRRRGGIEGRRSPGTDACRILVVHGRRGGSAMAAAAVNALASAVE